MLTRRRARLRIGYVIFRQFFRVFLVGMKVLVLCLLGYHTFVGVEEDFASPFPAATQTSLFVLTGTSPCPPKPSPPSSLSPPAM